VPSPFGVKAWADKFTGHFQWQSLPPQKIYSSHPVYNAAVKFSLLLFRYSPMPVTGYSIKFENIFIGR
jgi:hypothetical protein